MVQTSTQDSRPITEEAEFLKLKNVDHAHFWVGNAKHAMFYWWKGFGFKPVAYCGLEPPIRKQLAKCLNDASVIRRPRGHRDHENQNHDKKDYQSVSHSCLLSELR